MWLTRSLVSLLVATLASCMSATLTGLTRAGVSVRTVDASQRHLVTGAAWRYNQSHVPVRREIHDLKNNFPDQWSLYLLGLREFHISEQSNPLSYYEIAGIHGKAYKVRQDAQGLPGKNDGYCPHQNPLFLGWHRPYVALYEQEIYRCIAKVALRAPSHLVERFASATDSFRLPYWDWALGDKGGGIPDFFLTPTLDITGPDGLNQTIANPLYQYEFHPLMPGDFSGKWAETNHTLRYPSSDLPSAESQNALFIKNYNVQRTNFLDYVSEGFGKATSLDDFSMEHLEKIHGYVHYTIGGANPDGHMWPVEYAAFEPIFLLLHVNVDRLFALWQVAHPDKWFLPEAIGYHGNFFLADNQIVDCDTPLSPFWITTDKFWTTNDARDTSVLGYAYPETQNWQYATEEEYGNAMILAI